MGPAWVILPIGAILGLMIDYYWSAPPAVPASTTTNTDPIYNANSNTVEQQPPYNIDPKYNADSIAKYGIVWEQDDPLSAVTYGPYRNYDVDTNSYYYSIIKVPVGFDPHSATTLV